MVVSYCIATAASVVVVVTAMSSGHVGRCSILVLGGFNPPNPRDERDRFCLKSLQLVTRSLRLFYEADGNGGGDDDDEGESES